MPMPPVVAGRHPRLAGPVCGCAFEMASGQALSDKCVVWPLPQGAVMICPSLPLLFLGHCVDDDDDAACDDRIVVLHLARSAYIHTNAVWTTPPKLLVYVWCAL